MRQAVDEGTVCYPKSVPGKFGDRVLDSLAEDLRQSILRHLGLDLLHPSDRVRDGDAVVFPGGNEGECVGEESAARDNLLAALREAAGAEDDALVGDWLKEAEERHRLLESLLDELVIPECYPKEKPGAKKKDTPVPVPKLERLERYLRDCASLEVLVREWCGSPADQTPDGLESILQELLVSVQYELRRALGRDPGDAPTVQDLRGDVLDAARRLGESSTPGGCAVVSVSLVRPLLEDLGLSPNHADDEPEKWVGVLRGKVESMLREHAEGTRALVNQLEYDRGTRDKYQEEARALRDQASLLEADVSELENARRALEAEGLDLRSEAAAWLEEANKYRDARDALSSSISPLLERLLGSPEVTPEACERALEALGPAPEF